MAAMVFRYVPPPSFAPCTLAVITVLAGLSASVKRPFGRLVADRFTGTAPFERTSMKLSIDPVCTLYWRVLFVIRSGSTLKHSPKQSGISLSLLSLVPPDCSFGDRRIQALQLVERMKVQRLRAARADVADNAVEDLAEVRARPAHVAHVDLNLPVRPDVRRRVEPRVAKPALLSIWMSP
jgi:hypothetical protein